MRGRESGYDLLSLDVFESLLVSEHVLVCMCACACVCVCVWHHVPEYACVRMSTVCVCVQAYA